MGTWETLALAGALLVGSNLHAQVHKCVEPGSGRVTYSDSGCSSRAAGQLLESRKPPEVLEYERAQAEAARQRYVPAVEPSQSPARSQSQPSQTQQRNYANTFECRQAQREVDLARGSVTAGQAEKLTSVSAAQRKADLACLGPTGYRELEASRAEARERAKERQARMPAVHRGPAVITNCDPGGCNDNFGRRYDRAVPNLIGGGKTCTPAGPNWVCN